MNYWANGPIRIKRTHTRTHGEHKLISMSQCVLKTESKKKQTNKQSCGSSRRNAKFAILILIYSNVVGLSIHSMCKRKTSVYCLVFFFFWRWKKKKEFFCFVEEIIEKFGWRTRRVISQTEVCACGTQSINLWTYIFKH